MNKKKLLLWTLLLVLFTSCNKQKKSNSVSGGINGITVEESQVLSVPNVPTDSPVFTKTGSRSAGTSLRLNMNEGIPSINGARNADDLPLIVDKENGRIKVQLDAQAPVAYDDNGNPFVVVLIYKKAVNIIGTNIQDANIQTANQKMIFVDREKIILKKMGVGFAPFYLDPLNYKDKENLDQNYMLQFAVIPNASTYNQYTPIPLFALVQETEVVIEHPDAWAPMNGTSLLAMARESKDATKDVLRCSEEVDTSTRTKYVQCVHKIIVPRNGSQASADEFKTGLKLMRFGMKKTVLNNGNEILVYPGDPLTTSTFEQDLPAIEFNIDDPNVVGGTEQDLEFLNVSIVDNNYEITMTLDTKKQKKPIIIGSETVQVVENNFANGTKLTPVVDADENKLKNALVPILYQENLSYPDANERTDFLGNPKIAGASRYMIQGAKKWSRTKIAVIIFGFAALAGVGSLVGMWAGGLFSTTNPTIIPEVVNFYDLATNIYELQKIKECKDVQSIAEKIELLLNQDKINNFSADFKRKLYYGLTSNDSIDVWNTDGKVTITVTDFIGFNAASEKHKSCNFFDLFASIDTKMKQSFACTIQVDGVSVQNTICGDSDNFGLFKNSYFGIKLPDAPSPSTITFITLIDHETKLGSVTKHDYILSAPTLKPLPSDKVGTNEYTYYLQEGTILGNSNNKTKFRIVTSVTKTINAMTNEFFISNKK
jgi:hypothetical protein